MSQSGLTSEEAEVRLRNQGANSFEVETGQGWLRLVFAVLREPMLILLLAAGVINFLLAELTDAALLMAKVVIAMDSSMASIVGMFIAGVLLALISASSISSVKD